MAGNDNSGGSNSSPLLRPRPVDLPDENLEEGGKSVRPKESWKGDYVKSVVYSGLDAILTCFSLIASISGGHLSSGDVLVLGFANLVADGISMGLGDMMSTKTEIEMAANERLVTKWDVTNDIGNRQEQQLLEKYLDMGMTSSDAESIVRILSKYSDILVSEKMAKEKGMLPSGYLESPWKNGAVTFAAFLVFGSVPLLGFIILIPFTDNETVEFVAACALSAVALVVLGAAKAKIVGRSYGRSAATTVFNGAVAGASAYAIGWSLKNVAGLE